MQIEWNGEQQDYLFYLVISLSPLDFQQSYCTNGEDRIRRRWGISSTRTILHIHPFFLLFSKIYFFHFFNIQNLGIAKDKNIPQKFMFRSNTLTRDFSILLHFDLSGFLFRNLIFDVSIHHSLRITEWSFFFFFFKNQESMESETEIVISRIKIRGNFPTDFEISKI